MSFSGKILIVDDEAHVRKFVGLIVRQLGSPVVIEAGNGDDALQLYASERPDLVLLDVNMPGRDGLQTLRALAEIDPQCVVIMLTSLASRDVVEDALRSGAANYVRKDTPKEQILAALQQTILQNFAKS